jgi:hypothetical protein
LRSPGASTLGIVDVDGIPPDLRQADQLGFREEID